jgi:CHASE3 domain sensor protein
VNKKIILILAIVFVTLTIILTAIFKSYGKNYDVIQFSNQKPELVRALKNKYEAQVREVEKNLVATEKTPQDRLVEAVVDQISPKK